MPEDRNWTFPLRLNGNRRNFWGKAPPPSPRGTVHGGKWGKGHPLAVLHNTGHTCTSVQKRRRSGYGYGYGHGHGHGYGHGYGYG